MTTDRNKSWKTRTPSCTAWYGNQENVLVFFKLDCSWPVSVHACMKHDRHCRTLVDSSSDQREPAGLIDRRGEAGGDDGAAGDAATAGGVHALHLLRRRVVVVGHGAAADVGGAAAARRPRVPATADAAQPAGPGGRVRRPPWPRPAAVVS